MAYIQVQNIKRWIGYSYESKPESSSEMELAPGSEAIELDTGKKFIRGRGKWVEIESEDVASIVMGELLLETQSIRKGIELQLALSQDLHIDLRTEAVTQLQEIT